MQRLGMIGAVAAAALAAGGCSAQRDIGAPALAIEPVRPQAVAADRNFDGISGLGRRAPGVYYSSNEPTEHYVYRGGRDPKTGKAELTGL